MFGYTESSHDSVSGNYVLKECPFSFLFFSGPARSYPAENRRRFLVKREKSLSFVCLSLEKRRDFLYHSRRSLKKERPNPNIVILYAVIPSSSFIKESIRAQTTKHTHNNTRRQPKAQQHHIIQLPTKSLSYSNCNTTFHAIVRSS